MSTLTTIDSGDLISDSRSDINNNFSALNTDKIETSYLDTDTSLAANSDVKIATQKAVKTYIDTSGGQNASTTVRGIVEEATQAEVDAGTAAGATGARLFINPSTQPSTVPTVKVYGSLIGDSTTRFDITNPAGTTFRYTYDGTGTDPVINTTTFPTGYKVNIRATNMAIANEGSFTVTGSGSNYFEVTNASGSTENDKTISTGYIQVYNPTWTKPTGLKYAVVEVVGSGGGGGDDAGTAGSAGATSSFGSLLSATGGSAGARTGGAGGYGAGGDINVYGGQGVSGGTTANASFSDIPGGTGGASFFGTGGAGGYSGAGQTGLAFGSGGGGGGGASESSGGGGGAGGYAKELISASSLGSTETVTVAIGGAGATSDNGGSGGGGVVIVIEYYHV